MTSELRRELHGMVDDAAGVDLVDRALRTARTMRRARVAGGTVAALALVAVAVTPFALTGGRAPGQPIGRSEPAAPIGPVCTLPKDTPAIIGIILGHIPGAGFAPRTSSLVCGTPEQAALNFGAGTGREQLWVHLVSRADRTPGLSYPLGSALTTTTCAGLLDVQPSSSPLSFSPSAVEGGIPSSSASFSPSTEPDSPTPQPWASAPPLVLDCVDATATAPMVFEVSFGPILTAGVVYPDHRSVIARTLPPTSPDTGPRLTIAQLAAIATDPRLAALVPLG